MSDNQSQVVHSRSASLFMSFYVRMKDRPPPEKLPHIIALDPGETTGVTIFDATGGKQFHMYQRNTSIIEWGVDAFEEILQPLNREPTIVVIEDYRVYAWKAKQHVFNSLHTPRLIGVAESAARRHKIPIVKQSAQVGKDFVKDSKLQEWNLYIPALRHGMDSTRHLCQFLLFGAFQ